MSEAGSNRTIVYASCSTTREVVILEMDRDKGTLQELSRIVVPSAHEQAPGSMPVALSRDQGRLFVSLRSPPVAICSYAIDHKTGGLRYLGEDKLPERAAYMVESTDGRFMFTVSYPNHTLSVSPVGPKGAVGGLSQVLTTPSNPHCVLPDPATRYVYVASMTTDGIYCYEFDGKRGQLSQEPIRKTACRSGAGPKLLAFDRSGRRLYCLAEYDATVSAYEVNPETGELKALQCVSMLPADMRAGAAASLPPPRPGIGAGDIHVTADGRFLYSSDRPSNSLAAFRIDPQTGLLTLIGSVEAEAVPRSFEIEPSGRFLFCAGLDTGQLVTYAIDQAGGALKRLGSLKIGNTIDSLTAVAL